MPRRVICSDCQKSYRVEEALAGKRVKCPKGHRLDLPPYNRTEQSWGQLAAPSLLARATPSGAQPGEAWYRLRDGAREEGPLTAEELQDLADRDELRPTDLVWKEGLARWVEAATVPGLTFLLLPCGPSPATRQPATPPAPSDGLFAFTPKPQNVSDDDLDVRLRWRRGATRKRGLIRRRAAWIGAGVVQIAVAFLLTPLSAVASGGESARVYFGLMILGLLSILWGIIGMMRVCFVSAERLAALTHEDYEECLNRAGPQE